MEQRNRYRNTQVEEKTRRLFVHRATRDGRYRSVCTRCGKVVAIEGKRESLKQIVSEHVCCKVETYAASHPSMYERRKAL